MTVPKNPQIVLENLPKLVWQIFSADGLIAKSISNFSASSVQQDYACRVAKTLLTGEQLNAPKTAITLLEAETGTGKSLAYLVPLTLYAAVSSQRVAVSTYTLHLQRQLTAASGDLGVALSIAERLTGKKLSFAVRKGLRNFVSPQRVDEIVAAYAATAVPAELLALQRWTAASTSGDLQDWKENHDGQLPLGIQDTDVCLQAWDSDAAKAAYLNHAEQSRSADLVFITHAMLLLNNYRWFSLLDSDERPLKAVVVDEADRLEAAAESLYKRLIPLNSVYRLLQDISREYGVDTTLLNQNISQLQDVVDKARQDIEFTSASENHLLLHEPAGQIYQAAISSKIAALILSLDKLSSTLALRDQLQSASLLADKADLAKSFLNLLLDLQDFHNALHNTSQTREAYASPALRWSPVHAFPSLCLIPLYPARLTARLWRPQPASDPVRPYLHSCILTSATLSAPGTDMQDFERQIGIYRLDHHVCSTLNARFEPDRFGQIKMVLADPSAPSPSRASKSLDADSEAFSAALYSQKSASYTSTEWLEYCASMIAGAQDCGGRVLVLTTSFHNAIALGERVPNAIVHQPNCRLSDYVDTFRNTANAVWITPSGWEGLNLPGLIQHLVLTRLPFTPVDNARNTVLLRCLTNRGMDTQNARKTLFALSRNEAKRRFRQGFGRGIRHRNDHCTIWIADPRIPLPPDLFKQWIFEHGIPELCSNLYPDFVACIPRRFREGFNSSYINAKVWNYQKKPLA